MGLMAIEDAERRRQLAAMQPPPKKSWLSKRLAITLIVMLLVLNLGAVYWLYLKAKASADSLSTAENPGKFSLPGINNGGTLPSADVAGEDPSEMARYKNSVRTKYDTAAGVTTVEYQTKDPGNVVLGYYKDQLAEDNWIILYADSSQAIFSKGSQRFTINISTQNGLTTFEITY